MNRNQRIEAAGVAMRAIESLRESFASETRVLGGAGSEYQVEEKSWGYSFFGTTRLGIRYGKSECVEFSVLRVGPFSIAINAGVRGSLGLLPLVRHLQYEKHKDFLAAFDLLVRAGNRLGAASLYQRHHECYRAKAMEKTDEALEGHTLCTERGRIEKDLPNQKRILDEYKELHGDISPQARI